MIKHYKNIVISGDVGTGTSTLTLNLARALNWEFISAGDYFRRYALGKNIDLWDKLRVDKNFEYGVDNKLLDLAKNKERIIIEGHYQGWRTRNLIETFRIKTDCDPEVALRRTVKRDHTHPETYEEVVKRRQGLDDAFKRLYGNDVYLADQYFHLVVDTTNNSPAEVTALVLEAYQEANKKGAKISSL